MVSLLIHLNLVTMSRFQQDREADHPTGHVDTNSRFETEASKKDTLNKSEIKHLPAGVGSHALPQPAACQAGELVRKS